jgi:Bll4656 protein
LGTSFRGFEDILDYTARESSAIDAKNGPEGGKVIAMLKRGFAREVARKYAEICVKAIKSADPNHLILGGRFAGVNAKPVMRSFDIFDVISNNHYGEDPHTVCFGYLFKEAGRPIMLTEFSFRGEDMGQPNTMGAGIVVEGQSYGALYMRSWLIPLLEKRFFVGYLWWEYMDEPFEGRIPDAEDFNYGLVNLYDEPYAEVIEAFKEVNSLFPIL